ncbi:MAG: dihydrofolate reductase [Chitinophagales bacterium]
MILSAIVAVAQNNVIGMQGDMPWPKMSADLKYFKEKTFGKWCILGRKTYNALGNKVLPGINFIIITRDTNFRSADSLVVHSLQEAIDHPAIWQEEEVMVLGGGEIYKQAMPLLDRVYCTRIGASFAGDTYFPDIDANNWELALADAHTADDKNPLDYTFLIFNRK